LAGTCAVANAQSVAAAPAGSEATVTLKGVVSVSELAASQANLEALQNAPVVQPVHRLPGGGLTSAPSRETLDALPLTPEPNTAVFGGIAPSFASVKGFVGLFGGQNLGESEPPDQGLAVNNNVAAEHVNFLIRFFDATTGAPKTGPIADSKFFLVPNGFDLADPQVFFDPTTSRWFFDVIMFDNKTNTMDFAVAISQTSNPLGNYFIYHVRAFSDDVSGCAGQDCFPDYPKAGYDLNGLYIGANLISNVGAKPFVEAAIYVLPKSKLEAGARITYFRFDDRTDFVVQPSVPAPGEPFSTADNGSEFLMSAPHGSTSLALLAISNTNNIVSNGSTMRLARTTVAAEAHGNGLTVPSTQPNVIGPLCRSVGVTSAPSLDGGLSAFQATIQKAGGNLYGALAFGARDGTGFPRDVLAWFEVHPTLTPSSLSASIVHQGFVFPPNGFSISYPAFGLNKTGAGAMGMTITNNSTSAPIFPSAAFIQFTGAATGTSITIPAGGRGVTSDDGFTGCPGPGPGRVGRWGDYAAATVDAKTGFFYTANEMIPNPIRFPRGRFTNWGTFITQLHN
jgi:hypothetical protein